MPGVGDALRVGGSFTWIEGENDPARNGNYIALNGWRIPPAKLQGDRSFTIQIDGTSLPGVLFDPAPVAGEIIETISTCGWHSMTVSASSSRARRWCTM